MNQPRRDQITGIHKLPLFGALAVVLLAIVTVVGSVSTGAGTVGRTIGVPVAERMIGFRDEAGGVVAVFDAETNETIGSFGVGEGAFLRMAVRSMTFQRTSKRIRYDLPYRLTRTDSGKMSFIDPQTGHFIKLNAFGPVAISSFSALLPDHSKQGA